MWSEMGKLTSYILGMVAAVAVAYYLLASYYSPILGWLGPVLGTSLIFPLAFLFLLLGNFTLFPVLLESWVFLGIVVGIGARKGSRAVGAAITLYSSIWGFLGLSALTVADRISGSSLGGLTNVSTLQSSVAGGFFIPPLPPGSSISSILAEPLMQPVSSLLGNSSAFLSVAGIGTSTSSVSANHLVSGVISAFAPYLVMNLALFLIVSGLVGWAIHLLIEPGRRSRKGTDAPDGSNTKTVKRKVRKVKKVVRKVRKSMPVLFLIAVSAMMLLPMASSHHNSSLPGNQWLPASNALSRYAVLPGFGTITSAAGISYNSVGNSTTSINYGSGIVGKDGNVYNAYAFVNSTVPGRTQYLASGMNATPVLSAAIISSNVGNLFNALSEDGILSSSTISSLESNQYYNLIPEAAVILGFEGNLSATSTYADAAASSIAGGMGGSAPSLFVSQYVPYSQGTPSMAAGVSFYAYSTSTSVYVSENSLMNQTIPYLPPNGTLSAMSSGLRSGYLVPNYTAGSVNASIFMAGEINASLLPENASSLTSIFNRTGLVNTTHNMIFMGSLSVVDSTYHSSGTEHSFSVASLLRYPGNISFTSPGTAYAISMVYPTGNSGTSGYAGILYSTVPGFQTFVSTRNLYFTQLSTGSSIDPSSINATTNTTFPADISVTQAVVSSTPDSYNITITVTNADTSVISNVSVNGNVAIADYRGSEILSSGSALESASSLAPGKALVIHYSVRLKTIGTYVISDPVINYTMGNSTFSISETSRSASAQAPPVWSAANNVELTSFTTLSDMANVPELVQQLAPGFYVFDIIFILLVALDVSLEYRALERWRKRRKSW